MSSALEIGTQLAALCREGRNLEAIETLYSPKIVSVEACDGADFPREMQGLEAVKGKTQWWLENHEVHRGDVKGPFPHDDRFALLFSFDVTPKAGPMAGKRMQMQEVGLYTVADGKIVREEFFYAMPE